MKFDLVLTNPPFQDSAKRGRTPHKLWIEFSRRSLESFLRPGGALCQISPASFQSPSNKMLGLMRGYQTKWLSLDTGRHFPQIGSSFAHYLIEKSSHSGEPTVVTRNREQFAIVLDESVQYLPNDLSEAALAIHKKVVMADGPKLPVERDYVTCHNIRRRDGTLSTVKSDDHPYPVLHTNRQTWYSAIRQEFADAPKVIWSRSGYTKPFFDPGTLGGTDMVYFVRVASPGEGRCLAHNMNSLLLRYIYQTARWSGFGNERVFDALPALPKDRRLTDRDAYDFFELTEEEVRYVERVVEGAR
jgi:hypothetical protein